MPASFIRPMRPTWVRQLEAYWVVDGLPDLLVGGVFLTVTGWQTLEVLYLSPPPLARFAFVAFVFFTVLGGRWLLQRLKWRLTYPRTGYLRPALPPRQRRILGLLVTGLGGLLVVAALSQIGFPPLLPGLLSVFLTTAMLWLGWRYARPRYGLYAVAAFLGGVCSVVSLAHARGVAFLWLADGNAVFLSTGFAALLGGGVTLRVYLHRHPLPRSVSDE